MLEPVSDCWPRRMATAAQAEQNPAYVSTPTIRDPSLLFVVMGFLHFIDANPVITNKLGVKSRLTLDLRWR
ncbi:hypothetical protein ACX03_15055 [Vibrio parahaemolyticus]|uniref:Uncharacterized protein n=1 Tax=Vibrio antiquarius (strain Ex25) TaxID=150340 RepID=A0ACA6QQ33_VIBAE|nr:hypothetical protein VEA_004499 [Vibrio antiquarius]EMD78120.1 hypothetical protein C408_3463 [Vibrio diabolicus E0666]KLE24777.1 hypothetical protein AAW52_10255 [Vibrio diabolicus]KOY44705.1 hypothetical protein ACX03_15055 [Vibrio parahaemolyticus]BDR19314.1 hypothetical protein VspSTUT16_26600 [Vibrio sp. STUT-A16]GAJ75753.1 hypothetical protein JCM18905_1526 [Vibrio sp. JCM 18905]